MITKYILIVIFVHGYNSRINYAPVGEFVTLQACQNAAAAIKEQATEVGPERPRFVCAAKQ